MSEYNTSTYVTNEQMVKYCTNAIDNWAELLGDILNQLTDQVDEINGEVVRDNLVEKIQYLLETKEAIRDKIIAVGSGMPADEIFRNYPKWILGISGDWILKTVSVVKKAKPNIPVDSELLDFSQWLARTVTVVYKAGRRITAERNVPLNAVPTRIVSVGTQGTVNKTITYAHSDYPSKSVVITKEE